VVGEHSHRSELIGCPSNHHHGLIRESEGLVIDALPKKVRCKLLLPKLGPPPLGNHWQLQIVHGCCFSCFFSPFSGPHHAPWLSIAGRAMAVSKELANLPCCFLPASKQGNDTSTWELLWSISGERCSEQRVPKPVSMVSYQCFCLWLKACKL
jgi:hypothetical protein